MYPQNTTWALVKIAQSQSDCFTTETPYLVKFVGEGYDAPAIAKWLVLHHLSHNQMLWYPEVWYPDEQAAWSGDVKAEECSYQELVEAEALVIRKYFPCVTLSKVQLDQIQTDQSA